MGRIKISEAEQFRKKCQTKPEWFTNEILGAKTWEKQIEIIEAIRDHRRVSLSGCTSSSKTYAGAIAMLWWLFSFYPSRVLTFAPSGRQVKLNIWGYAKSLWSNAKQRLGGTFNTTDYILSDDPKSENNWYAIGFSTDEPDRARGIHGKNDLVMVDDAQGVQQPIFTALENSMASGKTHLILLFNKNVLSGEVYDSRHSKKHLYFPIDIPAMETPNYKAQATVIDGMIDYSQCQEWIKTHGWDSNYVRIYVRDMFPTAELDTLIPRDWLDLAVAREVEVKGDMLLGVDVAGQGKDNSVIVSMKGRRVFMPKEYHGLRTTQLTGEVMKLEDQLHSKESFVDIIGIGYGVVSELQEEHKSVTGVNVSNKSTVLKDPKDVKKGFRFSNLRAEIWWMAREAIDPGTEDKPNKDAIQLPNDPELLDELSSIKFWHNHKGELCIESKEDMKKRLGKSPDKADAFCLANYGQKTRKAGLAERLLTVITTEDSYHEED